MEKWVTWITVESWDSCYKVCGAIFFVKSVVNNKCMKIARYIRYFVIVDLFGIEFPMYYISIYQFLYK